MKKLIIVLLLTALLCTLLCSCKKEETMNPIITIEMENGGIITAELYGFIVKSPGNLGEDGAGYGFMYEQGFCRITYTQTLGLCVNSNALCLVKICGCIDIDMAVSCACLDNGDL